MSLMKKIYHIDMKYDKSEDRILLMIRYRGVPVEIIKKGVKYPELEEGWTAFDDNGNILLK